MIEDGDNFLVEAAAFGMVAALKHPLLFWTKVWEALWIVP